MGWFIGGVTHDIEGPGNAVVACVQMVAEKCHYREHDDTRDQLDATDEMEWETQFFVAVQ